MKIQVINPSELNNVIINEYGVVNNKLYKNNTARTYSLDTDRIIVELYDGRGVVLKKDEFDKLEDVEFIKSNIDFRRPRLSYRISLNELEFDRLIVDLEGKEIENLKPRFAQTCTFKVYELNNNQIIIKYKGDQSEKEESQLYEDVEALAYDYDDFIDVLYPDFITLAKDELLNGVRKPEYRCTEYRFDVEEVKQLKKVHELQEIKSDILYEGSYGCTLYKSVNDCYLLLEAKDLNEELIIPHVYQTMMEFKEECNENEINELSVTESGYVHPYQELSDKYGEQFPAHTFDEINKLPNLLNFDSTKLDFTSDCMSIINTSLLWNYGGEELSRALVYPILCYTGEYNKSQGKGNWKMNFNNEDEIWEPLFLNQEGIEVFDIYRLYNVFYDGEYGIPLLDLFISR